MEILGNLRWGILNFGSSLVAELVRIAYLGRGRPLSSEALQVITVVSVMMVNLFVVELIILLLLILLLFELLLVLLPLLVIVWLLIFVV